jgi:hypothetical protein
MMTVFVGIPCGSVREYFTKRLKKALWKIRIKQRDGDSLVFEAIHWNTEVYEHLL